MRIHTWIGAQGSSTLHFTGWTGGDGAAGTSVVLKGVSNPQLDVVKGGEQLVSLSCSKVDEKRVWGLG